MTPGSNQKQWLWERYPKMPRGREPGVQAALAPEAQALLLPADTHGTCTARLTLTSVSS